MKLKRSAVSEEIPTSSMADIAFLLIIYFMVTTTFAATRGLDFSLPQEDDSPLVDKEESVLIEINPRWSTSLNENSINEYLMAVQVCSGENLTFDTHDLSTYTGLKMIRHWDVFTYRDEDGGKGT